MTIWPKHASNEMLAPWGNAVKTAGGNGTKRPKTRPSETTPYRDRLSTIITLRTIGKHEGKWLWKPDESAP